MNEDAFTEGMKSVKVIPLDESVAEHDGTLYEGSGGNMHYDASVPVSNPNDFWAVMVAAKRKGVSFSEYLWDAAVKAARAEV